MMASTGTIADFAANKLLDHVMGDTSFTIPAAVYLAFDTTIPVVGDSGSSMTEPNSTWTNYARQQLLSASFDAAASRQKNYSAIIDFGTATTTTDTTLKGWAILNGSTINAGDCLWIGTTDGDVIVQNGNPVKVTAGNLDIKFSATLSAVA
jgi:hypothetical protein